MGVRSVINNSLPPKSRAAGGCPAFTSGSSYPSQRFGEGRKQEKAASGGNGSQKEEEVFSPRVDVIESNHSYTYFLELPGIPKQSVSVNLAIDSEHPKITISGTVRRPEEYFEDEKEQVSRATSDSLGEKSPASESSTAAAAAEKGRDPASTTSVGQEKQSEQPSTESQPQSQQKLSGVRLRRAERRFGSFNRVIRVPRGTKAKDVKAKMENGVLKIEVLKSSPAVQEEKRSVEIV